MKSKAQVIKRAAKLGCDLKLNRYEAVLSAPDGYILRGNIHYSVFEISRDQPKSEIWDSFYDEMSNLRKCEETCCDWLKVKV